jgi:hypothetical protein
LLKNVSRNWENRDLCQQGAGHVILRIKARAKSRARSRKRRRRCRRGCTAGKPPMRGRAASIGPPSRAFGEGAVEGNACSRRHRSTVRRGSNTPRWKPVAARWKRPPNKGQLKDRPAAGRRGRIIGPDLLCTIFFFSLFLIFFPHQKFFFPKKGSMRSRGSEPRD